MNSQENDLKDYNVRFYMDGKLMKSFDITASTMEKAIRASLDMVEGLYSWNEISVEQYMDKAEDDISC